jgi:hypothetical protein
MPDSGGCVLINNTESYEQTFFSKAFTRSYASFRSFMTYRNDQTNHNHSETMTRDSQKKFHKQDQGFKNILQHQHVTAILNLVFL